MKMGEKIMMLIMPAVLLALVILVQGGLTPGASAQDFDKSYEAAKSVELSSVKLQLATSSAATATLELTEVEGILRRLKKTTDVEERRKIASQLDLALTRLHIVADGTPR